RSRYVEIEAQARPRGSRGDPDSERRMVRVRGSVEPLHGPTDTAWPLDVEHAGVGELDLDAVFLGERRAQHLLLHAAVERHRGQPVLTRVYADQGVLVGELSQGESQRGPLLPAYRSHRRLERGRREVMLLDLAARTEAVADPDRGEAVETADLSGRHRIRP